MGASVGVEVWGGWIAFVFMALSALGLIAVHVLPTGLNPLRDPVSQYHLTRFRPVILVSTLCAAVAGVGAMLVLVGMLGSGSIVCVVLLVIFSLCRLLIPFLRMDEPGTPVTAVGHIHNVLAFGAFGAAVAVGFVAGGSLHDAGHHDAATWSTIFGIVGAIGAVGLLITVLAKRKALFGLFERLIYLGFIPWFLMIGLLGITS